MRRWIWEGKEGDEEEEEWQALDVCSV